MGTLARCSKCGDALRFFGRVSPLGSEPGIEFFKCDGCNSIAERAITPQIDRAPIRMQPSILSASH